MSMIFSSKAPLITSCPAYTFVASFIVWENSHMKGYMTSLSSFLIPPFPAFFLRS